MDPVRLVTVHPALVHVTLGAIPIIVLAYVIGWWKRSERWTFAGDVALAIAALGTLAAAAFGLVAFLALDWPGGLGLWRWLHLALGVTSTVVLVAFAAVRLARRRRHPVGGGASAWASIAIGLVVLGTGWVGGEVLVFHAGVAVQAAGEGALAPPIRDHGRPGDVETAMHRIRAAWARITASVAEMVVEHPTDGTFDQIARDAAALRRHAEVVAELTSRGEPRVDTSPRTPFPVAAVGGEPAHHVPDMARELADHARRLEAHARGRQLGPLADELGATTALCAHCHEETRWRE